MVIPLYADIKIGTVFTPLEWGIWAVRKYNLTEKWLKGASIFDPTCGEGHLLEALLTDALQAGKSIHELPLHNLYGVELNPHLYQNLLHKFSTKYQWNVDITKICCDDFLFWTHKKTFDIIFGNPPWLTFNALPENYKIVVKPLFTKYGLVEKANELLLGNSRIELAALVIIKSIAYHLNTYGEAIFFMPMSVLLNDGANKQFRTYQAQKIDFAITEIHDFYDKCVFDEVSTRYGLIHIQRNQTMSFPVRYYQFKENSWQEHYAKPLFDRTDPLSIIENETWVQELTTLQNIVLPKHAVPRQGINTCGANDMFIFDDLQEISPELVSVSNKKQKNVILPKSLVYPLLVSKNFNSAAHNQEVNKWVLLPYQANGKPLEPAQIELYPALQDYLHFNRPFLAYRRGTMINTWIKKGYFWALLGVGKYSFKPYKIAWEAYGRKQFKPVLFQGNWQANQSLQAYIPLDEPYQAQQVLWHLSQDVIQKYLQSMNMQGTMNWAQPGKIKRLIQFE